MVLGEYSDKEDGLVFFSQDKVLIDFIHHSGIECYKNVFGFLISINRLNDQT